MLFGGDHDERAAVESRRRSWRSSMNFHSHRDRSCSPGIAVVAVVDPQLAAAAVLLGVLVTSARNSPITNRIPLTASRADPLAGLGIRGAVVVGAEQSEPRRTWRPPSSAGSTTDRPLSSAGADVEVDAPCAWSPKLGGIRRLFGPARLREPDPPAPAPARARAGLLSLASAAAAACSRSRSGRAQDRGLRPLAVQRPRSTITGALFSNSISTPAARAWSTSLVGEPERRRPVSCSDRAASSARSPPPSTSCSVRLPSLSAASL